MPTLASLFGQETAVRALRKALEAEHLAGTYLFAGPKGVGKGALARAFAQSVACLQPNQEPFDACGICDSCRRLEAGKQPEIVPIAPAGEQMQIWQFWDRDNKPQGILSHTLSFAPSLGKRRVYILEQAESLTESAANSLLKVLEEPPPYALFILLASHPARVLPTIVSRSQVIRIGPVPTNALAAYLQERWEVPSARAAMLAAYAEGRIGQAVQMAQNAIVGEEIGKVMDFAEQLPQAPRVRALRIAEQIRKLAQQIKALVGEEPASGDDDNETASTGKERAGRRQLAVVLDLLIAFYRDLLTLRTHDSHSVSVPRVVNQERAGRLARLSQAGTPERWMRCLDALLLARRRLDANANVALVTEILAMTLVAP